MFDKIDIDKNRVITFNVKNILIIVIREICIKK